MQCWYFGNYPGLMNKAAGELAFLPFIDDEDQFLRTLARIDWPGHEAVVTRAWKHFMKGYANLPITLGFTWFGPLHCSIVWPLYLYPVDLPLAPTWKFGFPDSGDRIGECTCFTHSRSEVLTLLGRMDAHWRKGVALMESLEAKYEDNGARQMDIGLCKAIGLQIRSALDAFTFYDLREKLPFLGRAEQLGALRQMEAIVRQEIDACRAMKRLCLVDPRLGFHSEAEGYKFFPAKLDWRAGLLESLLATDFPKVAAEIARGDSLFPAYTGVTPEGQAYSCTRRRSGAATEQFPDKSGSWLAWRDGTRLHVKVRCAGVPQDKEIVSLVIEPHRLDPVFRLEISSAGGKSVIYPHPLKKAPWDAEATSDDTGWTATFTIPFPSIPWYEPGKPLRINVCRLNAARQCISSWVAVHPLPSRLLFGDHNSADLGWLLFPQ